LTPLEVDDPDCPPALGGAHHGAEHKLARIARRWMIGIRNPQMRDIGFAVVLIGLDYAVDSKAAARYEPIKTNAL
jgi:hypothetical protein